SRTGIPTFFEPLGGNNGDNLIEMGSEHLLEKIGTNRVKTPGEAELLLINGGFAISDIWKAGIEHLSALRREHPDTPMVIAPCSVWFDKTDFAAVLAQGRAPVTIYCREHYSEKILRDVLPADAAEISTSDDLAFELTGSKFLDEQIADRREEHVVYCMRTDKEGTTAGGTAEAAAGLAMKLPAFIRKPLKAVRQKMVNARGGSDLADILAAEGISQDIEVIRGDLSTAVDFDEFLRLLRRARLVISDRLHVGIFAYLIGKPVVMMPGRNHKIRGIVEYSMLEKNAVGGTCRIHEAAG
ncbi:MAG: polysaccharide pyruvyl transferase family protein, partial [Planctomycetota bacterium]